jgi:hypothetical protein
MFLPCATGALNTSGWVNLGMDECSSPCTVTSYDLWNKNKWRLSLCSSSTFTDIRTLVIILVPNIDKSENRMPWQGYNLPGNYLHQVPRRWGNKCRQIRSACHWQRMSPCYGLPATIHRCLRLLLHPSEATGCQSYCGLVLLGTRGKCESSSLLLSTLATAHTHRCTRHTSPPWTPPP